MPNWLKSDRAFQKVRSLLFYLSLFLFFCGLPLILLFALGYKFNRSSLGFVKTGLIYIKTQPEGANVYLNGQPLCEKTPMSIQELIPGVYRITLTLTKYYPWRSEVDVEAGKVSRIDKVILFPLRPDLERLNRSGFSSFRADTEEGKIYYLDEENRIVYRSDLEGKNFEDIASLPDKFGRIDGWGISPDKDKMFIFNSRQIGVVFLDNQDDYMYSDSSISLDCRREEIIRVFWHSDSYHLIVLTDKHVAVIEARALARAVNLVQLNKEAREAFYDDKRQVLYFSDTQRGSDGSLYNNLYKLELSPELYLLERLMKKANEESHNFKASF
ncbi:MAG: PEGA domain-containing protein [Candidatus Omnitrophica bacterium]|nr:PEGA domain-containing protein [Candidatus Omnitrophota bacterium]MDD5770632.1 PEGA domain-containing protein [Candidatus Omnitrophota bacterium]